jgi:nucleoside-diphosphate-sugar epimerase
MARERTHPELQRRVVVTGAAGLVGRNLLPRLITRGFDVVALDKHPQTAELLAGINPRIRVVKADLACDDGWQESLLGADSLVSSHAQIGGIHAQEFEDNNIRATTRLFEAARTAGIGYVVQISSSVVKSAAVDLYTESKKAQENLALASGIPCVVLRPTLMFGRFDRKHLGWLAEFMRRVPVFPVPGSGRYLRQPLYVGDFSNIVVACLERRISRAIYNISGLEKIDYIDLIRALRDALEARIAVVKIPYALFWVLLRAYALVDRNPPFTTSQLEALATPDVFEVIDWPQIFGVTPTPLHEALSETFRDPCFSPAATES